MSTRPSFHALLERDACTTLTSVFDPMSARLAELAGFKGGFVGSSVTSAAIHAAPDIGVLTRSELAEQVRRMTNASGLTLLVDADDGLGNALNTIWTVRELEAAGAGAVSIEDTALPQGYGVGEDQVISDAAFDGKLRAAVAARRSNDFCIVGQTIVLPDHGVERAIKRAKLIESAGADALLVFKLDQPDTLEAIASATSLPLILAPLASALNDPALLARCRVRAVFPGHQPFRAAIAALDQSYRVLRETGDATASGPNSRDLLKAATGVSKIDEFARSYLGIAGV